MPHAVGFQDPRAGTTATPSFVPQQDEQQNALLQILSSGALDPLTQALLVREVFPQQAPTIPEEPSFESAFEQAQGQIEGLPPEIRGLFEGPDPDDPIFSEEERAAQEEARKRQRRAIIFQEIGAAIANFGAVRAGADPGAVAARDQARRARLISQRDQSIQEIQAEAIRREQAREQDSEQAAARLFALTQAAFEGQKERFDSAVEAEREFQEGRREELIEAAEESREESREERLAVESDERARSRLRLSSGLTEGRQIRAEQRTAGRQRGEEIRDVFGVITGAGVEGQQAIDATLDFVEGGVAALDPELRDTLGPLLVAGGAADPIERVRKLDKVAEDFLRPVLKSEFGNKAFGDLTAKQQAEIVVRAPDNITEEALRRRFPQAFESQEFKRAALRERLGATPSAAPLGPEALKGAADVILRPLAEDVQGLSSEQTVRAVDRFIRDTTQREDLPDEVKQESLNRAIESAAQGRVDAISERLQVDLDAATTPDADVSRLQGAIKAEIRNVRRDESLVAELRGRIVEKLEDMLAFVSRDREAEAQELERSRLLSQASRGRGI